MTLPKENAKLKKFSLRQVFYLDPETDSDIIAYCEQLPSKKRGEWYRDAIRRKIFAAENGDTGGIYSSMPAKVYEAPKEKPKHKLGLKRDALFAKKK